MRKTRESNNQYMKDYRTVQSINKEIKQLDAYMKQCDKEIEKYDKEIASLDKEIAAIDKELEVIYADLENKKKSYTRKEIDENMAWAQKYGNGEQ